MKNAAHFLKNTKLRSRLLVSYLIICLVPLLTTTLVIWRFAVRNLEEESMELANVYSSQIVSNIEDAMEEYDRITKSVLVDNETLSDISRMEDVTISEEINNRLIIRRLLMRIAMLKPNVDNIIYWSPNGGIYQYSNFGTYADQEALEKEEWLDALISSASVLNVSPAHFKSYNETERDGIAVTVGRKLYDNVSREMGYLLIEMEPGDLIEMNESFQSVRSSYNIRIRVTEAESGGVLYDSDVLSGEQSWGDIIASGGQALYDEKEYLVITDTAHEGLLRVEAMIPRKRLMEKASSITLVSALVIAASVCMIVAVSLLVSRMITRPVMELQKKMVGVGEGEYHTISGYQSSDEIGMLIGNYNQMVERIQKLINDVYLAQIKQKDAKLMALRMQINPHMLYNTLESIRMKALVKGDQEAAEMLKLLSKMFRATLGKDEAHHTVRSELDYVESYIRLQNVRFQGRFSFRYEMGEALLDREIMPMVFQPIVENAISHGIRRHRQELAISLTGEEKENGILIRIQDDGAGMTPDKRASLNALFEAIRRDETDLGGDTEDGEEKSIGLKNIAERIYLSYGRDYYVRIAASGEDGTAVEIFVPG